MIERVIFMPEAEDEIAAAWNWYESREPGLGEGFLRSIDACIEGIRLHPRMYPIAIDQFRRALVRRFPYEIFYEPAADVLEIHAVFHCSQNPEKWRERLR